MITPPINWSDGLKVFTSFSPRLQRAAEHAVTERLKKLEQDKQLSTNSLQGALVVTDVGSGEVQALVGGRSAKYSGFNRALDIRRPIGSLVKPAVYLAALASHNYHWASLISDRPVTVQGQDKSVWQPRNFDRRSHGDVLLIDALSFTISRPLMACRWG